MFSLLLTITTTQAIGATLNNGCPSDIPNRYPGNNRCFQHVWYGAMCNVDPYNDPLSWQQSDTPCQYSDRLYRKKVLSDVTSTFQKYLEKTICPKSASMMVDCYRCDTADKECTEFMIFKNEDQLKTYNNYHTWLTPEMWSRWSSSGASFVEEDLGDHATLRSQLEPLMEAGKCERVLPSHGTEIDNECPSRLPYRYPGNNRCFESIWDGEMCNVNPQQDPLIWQQNDRQCLYDVDEKPDAGTFYWYSSPNDCSGGPIGSFEWSNNLNQCSTDPITISGQSDSHGSIFVADDTSKYFKLWCDADVLKSAVYSTSDCSGAPVRAADIIPRAASGNCHVRTNWKNGITRSHVNGQWFFGVGGGFKFADGEYPCTGRRSLKATATAASSTVMRRLLDSMH